MTRSTVGTALAAACACAGIAIGIAFGNGPTPADATDARGDRAEVECRVIDAWEDYSARVRVTFPGGEVRTFAGGGS